MANAEVAPAHQNPRAIRGMSHPLDASRIPWKTHPSDAPSLALGRGFWWAGARFSVIHAPVVNTPQRHSTVARNIRLSHPTRYALVGWDKRPTKKVAGPTENSPPVNPMANAEVAPAHQNPRAIRGMSHPLDASRIPWKTHPSDAPSLALGRGFWWAGARFSVIHAPVVNTPQRHSTVARNIRLSHPTRLRTRRVGQAAHQESRWSNRELSTRKPDGQRRGSAGPPESACHSRHVASPRRIAHPLENASVRCAVSCPGTRILVGRRSVFGDSRPCCEHTAAALDRGP